MLEQDFFSIDSLGSLYKDVQLQEIFPDSKYFVDCIPREDPAAITAAYETQKEQPGFDLKKFVTAHFILPAETVADYQSSGKPIVQHLNDLWNELTRQPGSAAGTLIPIPYPYVVPGGRFREVYYWDSYFTMLGLQVSRRIDLIESMVANFAYLIDTVGFIPNGNRTYYLGRSQPPFFTMMVELLAKEKGATILLQYIAQIEKEYAYWMDGEENLAGNLHAYRHVVKLSDGSILNRYWDDNDTPRPEAYIEDVHLASHAIDPPETVYRHIRAAAASGWDFSSRWFKDGAHMATIETAHLIPVDLNCLLLHTEETLLKIYTSSGEATQAASFTQKINNRKKAIQKYCWNNSLGFYVDYNFVVHLQNSFLTLAAAYPLVFSVADKTQAKQVATLIEAQLLKAGGLLTTSVNSGQQWDAPNGWAPLQWMAYRGLKNYGHDGLANEIKTRWMVLNEKVYAATGKMMEKYNVTDTAAGGGGGEYPNQDGFGWTNGVYLAFTQE